ncbi:MAG: FAD-binding protein, partial [Ruegeria sp.]
MELNPADETFAQRIQSQIGNDVLRQIEARYLEEPRNRFSGQAGVLALPRTTEEVSALVCLASDARVPVVPYGGGTGLVGGQVMPEGPAPLVIS